MVNQFHDLSGTRRHRAGERSTAQKTANQFIVSLGPRPRLTAEDYRALAREHCMNPLTDGPVVDAKLKRKPVYEMERYAERIVQFVEYNLERGGDLELEEDSL